MTLGDLLLDVIVRLEQPLAEGADADAVTRLGPGGQAANVAAWISALGGRARFVGKRATDEAGTLRAAGLERVRRRGLRPGRRGAHRDGRLARRRGRLADDGVGPRRLARARRRRARSGVARRLRAAPPARLLAPALADRRSRSAGGRACTASQRRPLLLERDPRLRPRAVPRAARGAPAGDRLRERGRGADPRRAARVRHVDPQARPARRPVRRARAAGAPGRASSTRRAPATRSPRATSSAARSWHSRLLRAASHS